jgi:NAD(P)-dependent dehydrogenase (short-subunit alcohol dehydrogenase family)
MSEVWFITGASNGMGLSMTTYLLTNKHKVIAAVRRPDSTDLAELKSKFGDNLLIVKVDVQNKAQIEEGFAKGKEVFGEINVVYNNAGYSAVGEVEAVPEKDARDMFETNFWGSTHVTLTAVNFFRTHQPGKGGRIIVSSSIYGLVPGGATGYYSASKYAVEAINESIALEIDPEWHIKITLADLGFFRTNFVKNHTYPVYSHPAYTNPNLLGNITRAMIGNVDPTMIKGDPDKLAKRIYEVSKIEEGEVPVRILLGEEAPAMLGPKLEADAKSREKWASWVGGLKFDE